MQRRRDQARKNEEREIEREKTRSNELECQNSQQREELNKLLHKFQARHLKMK